MLISTTKLLTRDKNVKNKKHIIVTKLTELTGLRHICVKISSVSLSAYKHIKTGLNTVVLTKVDDGMCIEREQTIIDQRTYM